MAISADVHFIKSVGDEYAPVIEVQGRSNIGTVVTLSFERTTLYFEDRAQARAFLAAAAVALDSIAPDELPRYDR